MWNELKVPTSDELQALLPFALLVLTALTTLLTGTLQRWGRVITPWIGVAGCFAAIVSIASNYGAFSTDLMQSSLTVDRLSQFLCLLILMCTIVVMLMSRGYNEREEMAPEMFPLTLLAALGMCLLVSTLDLVLLFIALEVMSLPIYVLVAMRRATTASAEAGLKYFILGSAASGLFLFGVALLFSFSGSVHLRDLTHAVLQHMPLAPPAVYFLGALFIAVGVLFKVGSFPFQVWVPDTYQGAAANITGFMSSAVKASAFGVLIRISYSLFFVGQEDVGRFFHDILWVAAVASMFFGNLAALAQKNLKRMLAYSTIAHTGYLLMGIVSAEKSTQAYPAVLSYLLFYAFMSLGTFAILQQISHKNDDHLDLEDLNGLGFQSPYLGFALSVFLLGMAGIPPTSGFIGKYFLFSAAVSSGEIWLAVLGVLSSVIGMTYYLRTLVHLYMRDAKGVLVIPAWRGAFATACVAALLTLQWGLFPGALLDRVRLLFSN